MTRDPCQPPLVVLSTVQPSSHLCQNLVSQGSIVPRRSQLAAGMRSLPHPGVLIEKPSCKRSPDQLVAQHLRPAPAWLPLSCRSPSLVQCAQSVPPHPACQAPSWWVQSRCCSMTQLSVNSAIGRSMRGHGCGKCCASFGPQSSGAIVAAVHSFAVWCGTTPCLHVPTHSRNAAGPPSECPVAALSAFRQPLGPGSAASTTPLAIRLISFAGGGENFVAVCFTGSEAKITLLILYER